MNTTDDQKRDLLHELKDKEYRDSYVSAAAETGISFQIKAIREQRGMNQTELANMAHMKQPRIHELESLSNKHPPTLSTLIRLANAFEVGLIVKFVPISALVKYDLSSESESLEVLSYGKDDYFTEPTEQEVIAPMIVTQESGLEKTEGAAVISILGRSASVKIPINQAGPHSMSVFYPTERKVML